MSDMLKRLAERRANLWTEARNHLDAVEASGDDLTGEAEQTWQRYTADIDALDKRIKEVRDVEERQAELEKFAAEQESRGAKPQPETTKPTDREMLARMARGELRNHEFRALGTVTATDGPELVPTTFYGRLMQHLIENSAIRQTNVTVVSTSGGGDLEVPKTTSHSTAAIVSEAGTIGASDPQFAQVVLGAFKYGLLIQTSTELLQDSGVDLEGYLAFQAGRALGNASGAHFVTGDGSSKPRGVATVASAGVTGAAAAAGAFTADNLIDLYYSVIAPYRANSYWMMSDAGIAAARKLKDDAGNYVLQMPLTAAEQATLLGKPVVSDTNVADPAADAKSVLYGDFSSYMIRDVNSVRVERSDDFAFDTDQVTWRFLLRTDGDQIDETGAIKAFVGGAAA